MDILKNKIVLANVVVLAFVFVVGVTVKSGHDSERYEILSPLFVPLGNEMFELNKIWKEVSSDASVSAWELNELICKLGDKLCKPWYSLFTPYGVSDAIDSTLELEYLVQVLKN
tara:strand:- start:50596 stop:50937 length:342 start_codon:yes stop_codon:yes gene_type:complete